MVSGPALRAAALFTVLALFLAVDVRLTAGTLRWQPMGLDFLAIWGGVRVALEHPSLLYDFSVVTQAQQPLLGAIAKVRPFPYPPSAALVFLPFGLMGYWTAYASFMLLSGALFLQAAWRVSGRVLTLVLLAAAPPVVLAVLAGQLSLLIGGLVLSALAARDRPVLSGVLLGLAAAVKPQLLVLFPLALLLERRWRTLAAALATGALVCAASAAVFGLASWLDWLGALPRFSRLIAEDRSLLAIVVTPMGALLRHGVQGPALIAAQGLCVLAGAAVVWRVFTTQTSTAVRLMALIGGGLLITPYALGYEFAIVAPAVALLAAQLEDPRWPFAFVALLLLSLTVPGLVILLGLLVCVLQPWRRAEPALPPLPISAAT
jgi:hypothetical protein